MKKLIPMILLMACPAFATNFVFYSLGATNAATAALADGRQIAVTLPETLTADDMVLMWASNASGYSTPVAINKTEAWWVGPDSVCTGQEFSVFGRNLSLGDGETYLWCEEESQWLTNSAGNAYKADYSVPEDWTNGTKTVWLHNGHGQHYGWSGSFTLTVQDNPWDWDEDSNNWFNVVTDYGAAGDGVADDAAEINQALSDADAVSGSTVYFPAGNYLMSTKIRRIGLDDVRLLGEGMDVVTIQPHSTYGASSWPDYLFQQGADNIEFKELTLKANQYGGQITIRLEGGVDVKFTNVGFDQYETAGDTSKIVYLKDCVRIFLSGCELTASGNMFNEDTEQVFVSDCTFIGCYDANTLFGMLRASDISLVDCLAHNYDEESSEAISAGWAKGRFIHGQSGITHVYVGDSATSNMCPRAGLGDQNQGEAIMFEFCSTEFRDTAVSATSNTVTFSSAVDSGLDGLVAVVVEGTGLGQSRLVSGIGGSTITVSSNWNVEPDTDSVVMVGKYSRRNIVYNNSFDGRERSVTNATHIANAGIEAYGGCVDLVAESNTFHQIRQGVYNWSLVSEVDSDWVVQPNYFNLYLNNTFTNCMDALITKQTYNGHAGTLVDLAFCGNAYIGNAMTDLEDAAYEFGTDSADTWVGLQVYGGNAATDFGVAIREDDGVTNQVWSGNTTNGVSWEP